MTRYWLYIISEDGVKQKYAASIYFRSLNDALEKAHFLLGTWWCQTTVIEIEREVHE